MESFLIILFISLGMGAIYWMIFIGTNETIATKRSYIKNNIGKERNESENKEEKLESARRAFESSLSGSDVQNSYKLGKYYLELRRELGEFEVPPTDYPWWLAALPGVPKAGTTNFWQETTKQAEDRQNRAHQAEFNYRNELQHLENQINAMTASLLINPKTVGNEIAEEEPFNLPHTPNTDPQDEQKNNGTKNIRTPPSFDTKKRNSPWS